MIFASNNSLSPVLSCCDLVGFSDDVSFCKLISKISLYIQNKFSVVSPVGGTLCFLLPFKAGPISFGGGVLISF